MGVMPSKPASLIGVDGASTVGGISCRIGTIRWEFFEGLTILIPEAEVRLTCPVPQHL